MTSLAFRSLLAAAALSLSGRARDATRTEWRDAEGDWNDAVHWSDGSPDANREAAVGGRTTLRVTDGTHLAGNLEVARAAGDRVRVEMTGGQLVLTQDSLFVGEATDSEGEFDLRGGSLHSAMDVFVGAATAGARRMNVATLRIAGGDFVARNLTVGLGYGARSRVEIAGSTPAAVHLLDYLYIEAGADPSGKPGDTTLAFALDEHGVTPITIQSHRDGLRILHDPSSHCRLAIMLTAVPPSDDIPLVSAHRRTQGTFDGLPEGAEISAEFAGHTYTWALTYRGGASGADLVLLNRSHWANDAPTTHVRPLPVPPHPLWLDHPLDDGQLPTGEPAFPGAEGFGAYTPGGRGGSPLTVDNLNDRGPGSLRAAIETHGPRRIAFRTGGTIHLRSQLTITDPNITIDGSTAPAPGITLWGHGIEVRTHDVVLRHLRIRIGDGDVRLDDKTLNYATGDGEYALYFVEGADNCIADHLSLSWSTNKMLSTTKLCDRITVQWCLLSESLNFAGHAYASIAGGNRITWHHNLFAHHQSRCVRFQGAVQADFRNNVVYDWGDTAGYGEFGWVNYVGNYLKPGPSTTQSPPLFHAGDKVAMPQSLYVADNVLFGKSSVDRDNWRGMGYYYERQTIAAPGPFPAPPVRTESAADAYEHVLAEVGATLPIRDPIDARIVHEVRTGTGHIIDHAADVMDGR